MIDFEENFIKVEGSISDNILPGRRKIKIRLVLKDSTQWLVLTLINIFYFFNSPSNLISLDLLNNAGIFYHNED